MQAISQGAYDDSNYNSPNWERSEEKEESEGGLKASMSELIKKYMRWQP